MRILTILVLVALCLAGCSSRAPRAPIGLDKHPANHDADSSPVEP